MGFQMGLLMLFSTLQVGSCESQSKKTQQASKPKLERHECSAFLTPRAASNLESLSLRLLRVRRPARTCGRRVSIGVERRHHSDLAADHRVMSMSFSVKKLLFPCLNATYSGDFFGNPLFMQQCLHAWPLRWTPKGSPQKRHHGPYRLRFGISTRGVAARLVLIIFI